MSFSTTNGSAAAGQDYTAAAGTLNWADGEDGVKTFNVAVANDGNDESNETVNLQLSAPTGGAVLGNPSNATMTIVDDDGATPTGTVQFTSTSFSIAEALPQATVSVSRTGGSQGAASVDYDTSNGTAIAGQDYTAVGGTLNWANGDAADKSFNIPILDDLDSEAAETLSIALSQPSGATLGSPAAATLTIFDNENVPPCVDGEFQVCLLGRFLANIHWVRPNNQGQGEGRVTKLTDSAASFEFFEPGNVEVVLKMKDACASARQAIRSATSGRSSPASPTCGSSSPSSTPRVAPCGASSTGSVSRSSRRRPTPPTAKRIRRGRSWRPPRRWARSRPATSRRAPPRPLDRTTPRSAAPSTGRTAMPPTSRSTSRSSTTSTAKPPKPCRSP